MRWWSGWLGLGPRLFSVVWAAYNVGALCGCESHLSLQICVQKDSRDSSLGLIEMYWSHYATAFRITTCWCLLNSATGIIVIMVCFMVRIAESWTSGTGAANIETWMCSAYVLNRVIRCKWGRYNCKDSQSLLFPTSVFPFCDGNCSIRECLCWKSSSK